MNQKKSTTTDKLYNLDIWVYNRVKFFSDKNMECFESNDSMAELFGRHKNRISASVNKLINLGYIKNNSKNKFTRLLTITEKELNINGVSLNKNGVSLNNISVEKLTKALLELNINGVENLTKAVLELNKSSDIYIELNKIFNKEDNNSNKLKKNNIDYNNILEWYNNLISRHNIKSINKLNQVKKDKLKKVLKDYSLEEWKELVERAVNNIEYIQKGRKYEDGKEWKAGFDYFTTLSKLNIIDDYEVKNKVVKQNTISKEEEELRAKKLEELKARKLREKQNASI